MKYCKIIFSYSNDNEKYRRIKFIEVPKYRFCTNKEKKEPSFMNTIYFKGS
jgi:hypothetical protein